MPYRPNDLLSVADAAAEKQVDVATIRRACKSEKLKCAKVNERAWVIRWRDLQEWMPTNRGRKRKDEEPR